LTTSWIPPAQEIEKFIKGTRGNNQRYNNNYGRRIGSTENTSDNVLAAVIDLTAISFHTTLNSHQNKY
jgi:hypothetical protein